MGIAHYRIIESEEENQRNRERIAEIMGADMTPETQAELRLRQLLAEDYEQRVLRAEGVTPAKAIEERMKQLNLERRDLEPFIGSPTKVGDVLNGRIPLTMAMIRALHAHLNIPADLLLREQPIDAGEATAKDLVKSFPFAEMVKLGYFKGFGEVKDRKEEAIQWLFAKAKVAPSQLAPLFRKNDTSRRNAKVDNFAIQAWCLKGLADASEVSIATGFDRSKLSEEWLRHLAQLSIFPNGPLLAREFLAQYGIRLVIVQHLQGTHVDGAALMSSDGSPVIILSLRYDRVDSFWHSLLHECVHVWKHLSRDQKVILDDLSIGTNLDEIELEADQIAAEALLPAGALPSEEEVLNEMTAEQVKAVASQYRVHPLIVAGRIRHLTKNWKKFARWITDEKEKVRPQFAV